MKFIPIYEDLFACVNMHAIDEELPSREASSF
jgi:hypothetical protein